MREKGDEELCSAVFGKDFEVGRTDFGAWVLGLNVEGSGSGSRIRGLGG